MGAVLIGSVNWSFNSAIPQAHSTQLVLQVVCERVFGSVSVCKSKPIQQIVGNPKQPHAFKLLMFCLNALIFAQSCC